MELVFGAERGLKWAALGGQIGRDTTGLLRKTGTEEKQRRKEEKGREEGGLLGSRGRPQEDPPREKKGKFYGRHLVYEFIVASSFIFLGMI
ncbi:hypothetical protein VitviT2T_001474 [Vitis vinifera]|uniref:Uncharacterized protein n=1 Tax=Vitis vinifera TaxID=29760 RepID=A0ABY9BH22_VITVI|nr:hypothetical protein VitviT2T_001474 [Vitis vinifera]